VIGFEQWAAEQVGRLTANATRGDYMTVVSVERHDSYRCTLIGKTDRGIYRVTHKIPKGVLEYEGLIPPYERPPKP
jgi:hypothetical protein